MTTLSDFTTNREHSQIDMANIERKKNNVKTLEQKSLPCDVEKRKFDLTFAWRSSAATCARQANWPKHVRAKGKDE